MAQWAYVEARDVAEADTDRPMVSFAHVKVTADKEQAAYEMGAAAMDTLNTDSLRGRSDSPLRQHFNGRFLNDYVVEL